MSLENLKTRQNLTLDEINLLMNSEKDINIYKKLQYFKFNKMGYSKIESCTLAGFPESSRYYLDDLWAEGGYNALIPHYGGGRKSKLSEEQIKNLEIKLKTKDKWLVEDVRILIKEEYSVDYTYQNVRDLLIRLNIPIANYFEIQRENKKMKNTIENYNDIPEENKKEINELTNIMKEEKSLYVYRKLSYLLFRKIGLSNKDASELLNITTTTGNNWLNAWLEKGYGGLLRKKGQGRKPKLTEEELEILKKKLSERDDWLPWEILAFIKKEFKKEYHPSYIVTFLKKNYNIKYAKPYRRDYRRSPYYKSTFKLNLYQEEPH